jgi:hypothetical protein
VLLQKVNPFIFNKLTCPSVDQAIISYLLLISLHTASTSRCKSKVWVFRFVWSRWLSVVKSEIYMTWLCQFWIDLFLYFSHQSHGHEGVFSTKRSFVLCAQTWGSRVRTWGEELKAGGHHRCLHATKTSGTYHLLHLWVPCSNSSPSLAPRLLVALSDFVLLFSFLCEN